MFTFLKRILKFGWQSFSRNKGLGMAVIFVMTIAISALTSLFIFNELSKFLISKAQDQVDISVYFKNDTAEKEILDLKEGLYDKFSNQTAEINYVSKEKAKEIFLSKHKDEPLYLRALEETGGNPFLSSLNIKAKDPAFYAPISDFLVNSSLKDSIEKISYFASEKVINKLSEISLKIKKIGIYVNIFLMVLVFLITFNTIKLTIFIFREEIATMRLVGASNWFIRGPFLVQSLLYGAFSILIVNLFFVFILYILKADSQTWLFGFNFLQCFKENFLKIFGYQVLFAFILGGISFFSAVHKYLKL
ncbi:permease-like cell division protein FtsX [Patescibacteria group bacterium]|nr:permease-like cell division protein FtsX [Patescibacteria group bacterium]